MTKSNSASSVGELSPPPKKMNKEIKRKEKKNKDVTENIEESRSNSYKDSDKKVDSG